MSDSLPTVILGAGVAGLAAAHALRQAGEDVTVLEANSRAGGCIQTLQRDGYMIETGPNSFPGSATDLIQLAHTLNLKSDILPANKEAGRRYVFFKGKLQALPDGLLSFLTTPLFGWRSRLRILSDPFTRPFAAETEQSFADFVRRKAGQDVLDSIASAFVSGVYAGDAERLSLQAAFPRLARIDKTTGSLMRGLKHEKKINPPPDTGIRRSHLCSFRLGLSQFTNTIATKLGDSLRLQSRVVALEKQQQGYRIAVETANTTETVSARRVILALPLQHTLPLLSTLQDGIAPTLQEIPVVGLCSVFLGFRRDHIPHPLDGFGFLVPRQEGLRLLGSIWSSSLFPHRAPEHCVGLTNFIGGVHDPDIMDCSDDEIVEQVMVGLRQTLHIKEAPSFVHVTRHHKVLPQYTLGHLQRVDAARQQLADFPDLYLIGNYLDGISVNDCLLAGQSLVKTIVTPNN